MCAIFVYACVRILSMLVTISSMHVTVFLWKLFMLVCDLVYACVQFRLCMCTILSMLVTSLVCFVTNRYKTGTLPKKKLFV